MTLARRAVWTVVVALAYLIAGRLALLLAIPPGYATAVWPAAGIALVCVHRLGYWTLPGVFLGSVVVNVWTSLDTSGLRSVVVAAMIGVGAAVQAATASMLVRRFVEQPLVLERDRDVLRFLALGGPVACVVGATVGVVTLIIAGILPASGWFFNWWTWWVGDVIGVTVFSPLLLALLAEPADAWRPRRRWVAIPLALGFVIITILFVRVSAAESERLRGVFATRATAVERALARTTGRYVDATASLAAFYEASSDVTPASFHVYASAVSERHPGIAAVSWIARVPRELRGAYERDAHAIWEASPSTTRAPAGPRDVYFPIARIEPFAANQEALGFDIGSEPVRQAALQRATQSGEPTASAPIDLIQDASHAFLLLVPVNKAGSIIGYASTVVRHSQLSYEALVDQDLSGLAITFDDLEAPARGLDAAPRASTRVFEWTSTIDVAGRQWRVIVASTIEAPRSWAAWFVLAGGLSILAMLGGVLLLITGRSAKTAAIERDQRFTLELSDLIRASQLADSIYSMVAERLGAFLGVARCAFNEVRLEQDSMTLLPGYHRRGPLGSVFALSSFSPLTQAELKAGRTVVVDDTASDPRTADHYHAIYATSRFRSMIGVPLLVETRWTASLWVLDDSPRRWEPREVVMVQSIAERAWAWIGHLHMVSGLEQHIVERTRDLERSLHDKDILLREIHHRVKNNLAVISSLLNLQANTADAPEVSAALADSRDRVQSIALVHDQLYRAAANVSSIDLDAYLRQLIVYIERTLIDGRLRIRLAGGAMTLSLDKAVPCGLVVNELITNAVKHAFPNGRAGTITVSARIEGETAVLAVEDDGVGLPPGFDLAASTGLGMAIVSTLATQLEGALQVSRSPGATIELRFPVVHRSS